MWLPPPGYPLRLHRAAHAQWTCNLEPKPARFGMFSRLGKRYAACSQQRPRDPAGFRSTVVHLLFTGPVEQRRDRPRRPAGTEARSPWSKPTRAIEQQNEPDAGAISAHCRVRDEEVTGNTEAQRTRRGTAGEPTFATGSGREWERPGGDPGRLPSRLCLFSLRALCASVFQKNEADETRHHRTGGAPPRKALDAVSRAAPSLAHDLPIWAHRSPSNSVTVRAIPASTSS
ncbi:hypothetical protein VT03_09045 [Planctomyces sp. SH-PL14]|nr:hypothetical protein VT03_09045 [Planctomyces sp. SH-PL14]